MAPSIDDIGEPIHDHEEAHQEYLRQQVEQLCRVDEITTDTATRLIEQFGSLYGVCSTAWGTVAHVDGIRAVTAKGMDKKFDEAGIYRTSTTAPAEEIKRSLRADLARDVGFENAKGWLGIEDVHPALTGFGEPGIQVTFAGDMYDGEIHATFPVAKRAHSNAFLDEFNLPYGNPVETLDACRDNLVGRAVEHVYDDGFAVALAGRAVRI